MVHFDVRPSEPVVRPLLQIERVELVGLSRRSRHQMVEHGGVAFYSRAIIGELQINYHSIQRFKLQLCLQRMEVFTGILALIFTTSVIGLKKENYIFHMYKLFHASELILQYYKGIYFSKNLIIGYFKIL